MESTTLLHWLFGEMMPAYRRKAGGDTAKGRRHFADKPME